MSDFPGRRAESREVRRDLAAATAALDLAELDVSEATSDEAFRLLEARGRDRGRPYTLTELVALSEAGEDFPAAGPEALEVMRTISARTAVRRRFGLSAHSCAFGEGICECLHSALDELAGKGGAVTKRRIVGLVRRLHVPVPARRAELPLSEAEATRTAVPDTTINTEFVEPDAGDPRELDPVPVPVPDDRRLDARRGPVSPRAWRSQKSRDVESQAFRFSNTKW